MILVEHSRCGTTKLIYQPEEIILRNCISYYIIERFAASIIKKIKAPGVSFPPQSGTWNR